MSGAEIAASMGSSAVTASEPAAQAPATETKVETTAPAATELKGEDDDFVRRFNSLTRREKMLNERDQEIKGRWNEFQEYQKERESLKNDPVSFMEKHGWKFNDLADFVLNDRKMSPEQQISKLQEKLDRLENDRKREKEEAETQTKRQKYDETIGNYKKELKTFVQGKGEELELVNHFGEYEMVYDVIESYYNTNGTILDVAKAAQEVEKYLEAQLEKATSTKKFKSKFATAPEEKRGGEEAKPKFPPESGMRETPRTLSNDSVSSSASTTEKSNYLSDEESKARAAEMIRQSWLKRKGYIQ